MKKSYHSIAVPTVEAMTARRSCALCSASGSPPTVVAIAMAYLPVCSFRGAGLSSPGLPRPRYVSPPPMAIDQRSRAAPLAGRGRLAACAVRNSEPCRRGSLGRPVRRHHGDRLIAILIGEQPLQVGDFRLVVDDDVRIGRVQNQKVLVVVLGRIKTLEGFELGHDRRLEDVSLIELGHIGFRNPLLLVVGIENRRAEADCGSLYGP